MPEASLTASQRAKMIGALLNSRYPWASMLRLKSECPQQWKSNSEQARSARAIYAQALADRRRMRALSDGELISEAEAKQAQRRYATDALLELEHREHATMVNERLQAERSCRRDAARKAAGDSARKRTKYARVDQEILTDEVQRLRAAGTASAKAMAANIEPRQKALGMRHRYSFGTLTRKIYEALAALNG